MNSFLNILKDYQVGKWCKVAAWVAAAIGLVNIVLGVYASVEQYNAVRQFGQSLPTSFLVQEIRLVISTIPTFIFYFFILYAAGVVVNRFVGGTENDAIAEDEVGDEDESDLALDEEDSKAGETVVGPGQMV